MSHSRTMQIVRAFAYLLAVIVVPIAISFAPVPRFVFAGAGSGSGSTHYETSTGSADSDKDCPCSPVCTSWKATSTSFACGGDWEGCDQTKVGHEILCNSNGPDKKTVPKSVWKYEVSGPSCTNTGDAGTSGEIWERCVTFDGGAEQTPADDKRIKFAPTVMVENSGGWNDVCAGSTGQLTVYTPVFAQLHACGNTDTSPDDPSTTIDGKSYGVGWWVGSFTVSKNAAGTWATSPNDPGTSFSGIQVDCTCDWSTSLRLADDTLCSGRAAAELIEMRAFVDSGPNLTFNSNAFVDVRVTKDTTTCVDKP